MNTKREEKSLIKIKEKSLLVIKEDTYKFTKRFLDILLSGIGITVLWPVFLLIIIAIKLENNGKVFFKHKRVGKNGKVIYVYKFQTMLPNAAELFDKLTKEQKEEYKKYFKIKDDPRVTKVGNFLRKTSLDELPQLLNILKGDMSIIGPRPVTSIEVNMYEDKKAKLLSIRPGLTGYWQANGRNNISYKDRIEMELYYVENQSMLLDIKIFFKTIISVLKKEGAM